MKTLLKAMALSALTIVAPAQVMAQDSDDAEVTKMAKEHYKLGLDAYKAGKYDVAIKELKKAYLLKRLPALLLNIGATYRKMGDLDLALHFYKKYLDEAPPEARDRNEVEKTIADIKVEKEGGGAAAAEAKEEAQPPKHEEPPPPPRKSDMPKEWSHSVVDAAPPDTPLDVAVSMPVMKGVKVFVYYRSPGKEEFTPVLMKRKGTQKVGRIPPDVMQGKAIQYYIEARDPAGTVVNSSGSQTSPNVVMIDPSAKPVMLASMERERDTAEPAEREREPAVQEQRRNLDDESAPVMGEIDEKRAKRREARRPSGPKSAYSGMFWGGVGLLAGGAAIAIGGGAAFFSLAKQKADGISNTSMNPIDADGKPIFFNNDPVASANGFPQEAGLEADGKMFDSLGIAFTVIGSVAAVTGAVLMGVAKGLESSSEKPRRKKRRVVIEEEAWLTPAVGPGFAGAATGFSF